MIHNKAVHRILAGVIAGVMFLPVGGPGEPVQKHIKTDWVSVIISLRGQFSEKEDTSRPKFGPWYATAPIPAKNLSDTFFPENSVDLNAKSDNGQSIWTKHDDWFDGIPHQLSAQEYATVYLYRTIDSPAAQSLPIGLGSDDGVELWLNGVKILSHDIDRSAAPDQEHVTLNLKPGTNSLLMKVYNHIAGSEFYFGAPRAERMVDRIADQLWKDYPVEMDWLLQDGPGKAGGLPLSISFCRFGYRHAQKSRVDPGHA